MSKRSNNDVRVYNTTFNNAKQALEEICKREIVDRKVLYNAIGISRVVLIKTLAPLFDLGFIDHAGKWHASLAITPEGRQVLNLLQGDDKEALRRFMLGQIPRSPSMLEAYRFLVENPYADYFTVGQHVTEAFGKTYKEKILIKNIGRSYVNLLHGFGASDCKPFTRVIAHEGKFLPRIFGEMIITEIERFTDDEPVMPYEPSASRYKRSRKRTEYKSLVELGISYQVDNELFKLTPVGKRLKEGANTPEQVRLMRGIITSNENVSNILRMIREQDAGYTEDEVGDILEQYNKEKWKNDTKKVHARRFLSWLRMAGMLDLGKGSAPPEVVEEIMHMGTLGTPGSSDVPEIMDKLGGMALAPPSDSAAYATCVAGEGLNRLNLLLLKVLTRPGDWSDDVNLKGELLAVVDELKSSASGGMVFKQMGVLIEMGFKHRDIECIAGVARDVVEMGDKGL